MASALIDRSRAEREAFAYIIRLVRERAGIRLHEGKVTMIQTRLGKRIRELGLSDLPEYCACLRNATNADEINFAIEALTTNVTRFLREEAHFQFLVREALPSVVAKGERDIRIWCAASSTGEEAYSLGIYLEEHFPSAEGWDWRITASDIAEKVLNEARRGVYPEARLAGMPPAWLRRYFQRGTGDWTGHVRVKPVLAERIAFRQINLIQPYRHAQPFHVIFCRNVLIYFDRPTQTELLTRLCQFVLPGGYIVVGHSESLSGLGLPLRCLKASIYQRH